MLSPCRRGLDVSWISCIGHPRPSYFRAARAVRNITKSPTTANQGMRSNLLNTEIFGQTGRLYRVDGVLQSRDVPERSVYLATAENERFILKTVDDADYYQDIYRRLRGSPHVRLSQDTINERSMFVYPYLRDHLLDLAQKDVAIASIKKILRDALRGLAALHAQGIVHTDVKANNIMVNWKGDTRDITVQKVQLADIEDAAYVPPRSNIVGKPVGNWMWRSPEAHAQGRVNKPSDIFSFGIVCIFAVLKRAIFAVDERELGEGEETMAVVMERQISYFGDADGLEGLLKHLDDSPWCEVFKVLWNGFSEANPREPFALWRGVDADFKDLVAGLTNLDPSKRLAADQALMHPWFQNAGAD